MKISARNRFKGGVVNGTKGRGHRVRPHRPRQRSGVTSSIANEAVDELELTVGSDAYAVIKASDVMVAID